MPGKRQKNHAADIITYIIESDRAPAACRKSWARLIQKISEVDPLVCPKCRRTMRIISFIEDDEIRKAILDHLGLWLIRSRPPARAHAPPSCEYAPDDMARPTPDNAPSGDPEYPWDASITS